MNNEQYISMYDILKKDLILVILIFSYLISIGISWIIPTPTYPFLGPFIMFPFYISIYFIYMFICKLLNKDYWIPHFTKKIKINKKILDKYTIYDNRKTNLILYIYVFILILCLLIPIFDTLSAGLIVFVIISYYKKHFTMKLISIIVSTIYIMFYLYAIINIKKISYLTYNIIVNNKKNTILIGILWFSINIYLIYKNIPKYKKYIKLDKNISMA